MDQQTIVAPSGRTYEWTKPTPPTPEDWKALEAYEASVGAQSGAGPLSETVTRLAQKAKPQPEPDRGLPGVLGTIGEGVTNLAVGAAKSIPETLLHLSQMITNLSGQHQVDPQIQAGLRRVAPNGTMQSIGRIGGQIAQSVLPAGAVSRGAQMAETGIRAIPVVSALPKAAQAVLGGAGRAAVEGAGSAVVSGALGGDPMTGGVAGAAMSAAQPLVKAGSRMLAGKAEDTMVRALGREAGAGPLGKNDLLTARKRAPELLERRFGALTQEGAAVKASDALDAAGASLDKALKGISPNRGVNLNVALRDIQSSMNALKLKAPNGSTFVPEASQTEFELLGRLKSELETLGGTIGSAQFHELRKLRQAWDSLGKWNRQGTLVENVQAETYRAAANAVRTAMARNNPAVAAANKEFAFWSDIADLTEKATLRPSNGPGMVSRGIGMAGGAAAGSLIGGPEGAAVGSLLGNYAVALTKTNGWRYVSANAKNQLATALASGIPSRVRLALSAAVAQVPQQFRPEAKAATGDLSTGMTITAQPQNADAIRSLIQQTMADLDRAQSESDRAALLSRLAALQQELGRVQR